MGKIWFLLYNVIAVPLQYFFYQVARYFDKKIAEGFSGRKGQSERIRHTLESIEPGRTKILFHCVSVGEWEQALPMISRLKNAEPDIYIIVAFFSPSGYNFVKEHLYVDLKIHLPFDSYFRAKRFLELIQPDLWIIVKHDIWPNHMYAARNLNIPTILIDATLPSDSRRIAPVIRNFNRSVYHSFHYLFSISEDDRNRFLTLYPYPDKIIITGDTRFDQVNMRGQSALNNAAMRLFDQSNANVFIAGSIWPSDEKYLLPAVHKLLEQFNTLNIILVPHEPDERHLRDIEIALNSASIPSKRYSEIKKHGINGIRVAIIDAVGLLVQLYSQSDIAYVGGSFGSGVHNVMEPGILGKPVLFGPKYLNSFEASELINCGGGFSVLNSEDIAEKVGEFLRDSNRREEAGNRAMQLMQQNLGATTKIYNYLENIYDFIPEGNSNRNHHVMQ